MPFPDELYSAARYAAGYATATAYWAAEAVVFRLALPLATATANKVAEVWKGRPTPKPIIDDDWEEIKEINMPKKLPSAEHLA